MTPFLALAVLQAAAAAPVVHASRDDCAIVVAIGKAELGWSPKGPGDWPFFPTYDLAGGRTYVEDCSWRALGVAPPRLGSRASMRGSGITRPAYEHGRTTATSEVSTTMRAKGLDGRPLPPYLEDRTCKLQRRGGVWRVVTCVTRAIT